MLDTDDFHHIGADFHKFRAASLLLAGSAGRYPLVDEIRDVGASQNTLSLVARWLPAAFIYFITASEYRLWK